MKAVRIHRQGDIDVLQYEDAPAPTPHPGELLVRVKACALNHLDIWVRQGGGRFGPSMPHILGSDVAGIVEACGPGADIVQPGTKVMVHPGLSCGYCQRCLSGRDDLCPSYVLLGTTRQGGYAELIALPLGNVFPMPSTLSFEEAASVPLVFTTAWRMVVTKAGVVPGDWVLVQAAGSGVGSAAIQIAKLFGAKVITTAGSEGKLEKARALGADHTVNYSTSDFVQEVMRITQGRGVDVVIDSVGGSVFENSLRAMAMGGRLVTCGSTANPQAQFDIRSLYARRLSILGSFMGSKGELLEAMKFVESGILRPVVHVSLPLKDAREAHVIMAERKNFGKIVLMV